MPKRLNTHPHATVAGFKSAAELGLRRPYWHGLITTLTMLESGAVQFVRDPYAFVGPMLGFNMSAIWEESECGSLGCIQGWGMHFAGLKHVEGYLLTATQEQKTAHARLVMPNGWSCAYVADYYTPELGAKALRSYLETGAANWPSVAFLLHGPEGDAIFQ